MLPPHMRSQVAAVTGRRHTSQVMIRPSRRTHGASILPGPRRVGGPSTVLGAPLRSEVGFASQPDLYNPCPVATAVESMAGSGIEARGAIFPRPELVDFF